MLTLYGIPNCDTVKKAREWLNVRQVAYEFYDFKKMGINPAHLQGWIAQAGLDTIMNKRGTTWRKLTPEQQALSVATHQAIALMVEYPSLIKRPILEADTNLYIGFDPDNYQRLLSTWMLPKN